jgi:hypothetical protein
LVFPEPAGRLTGKYRWCCSTLHLPPSGGCRCGDQ